MDELRKILGKRIKELRLAKNLTQEELAELVGVEWKSISRIEVGHSFPSKKLLEISKALNTPLPDLFDFDHLKVDIEYKKKYITENIKEMSSDNITIIYRLMKSMK